MSAEPLTTDPLIARFGIGLRPSPILGIFLTVFIDLLGFGMFIPDVQLRGHALGASGWVLGMLLGVFSLAQLLTAPFLGKMSDHSGRRSVLLVTTVLSTISYVVYAHTASIGTIFLSRAISGIAAANVGVAFAYIADVTAPEHRAKGLGAVGAAFGLGFIFGPPIGAWLAHLGNGSPAILGYSGAFLAAINFLYVLLILPDSRQHEEPREKRSFVQNLRIAASTPGLALLLVMFFTLNLGFTNLETTFFILLEDKSWIFHLGRALSQEYGAYILTIVGVIAATMQGGVVRRVVPKFGEVRVLRVCYLVLAPALALVPFMHLWWPMLCVVLVMGICQGLSQPSISSLISRSSPKSVQGGIFGITQSLGATARFIGPLISNPLFFWRPYSPYILGASLILIPAIAAWWVAGPAQPSG